MPHNPWQQRKIVIVGAGSVGATFAFALAQTGDFEEIVIVDSNQALSEGQVLDLAQGFCFMPTTKMRAGGIEDYADADVIVITAGSKQRPDESRLNLLKRNQKIMCSIADDIKSQDPKGVILVVSNPVDILTKVVLERTGLPANRVFGSGTVLDSARLRYYLADRMKVDIHNVHAYVLGEHGDSEFTAWSIASIGCIDIDQYSLTEPLTQAEKASITENVQRSAYKIIEAKGSTYFAIGMALVKIVSAIIKDKKSLLTVSRLITGQHGIDDVCISLPCIVSKDGAQLMPNIHLSTEEQQQLVESANILKEQYATLQVE
ncbi:L-lactate dehydrogenase [Marinicellulosiphila megalodicopiae]|uniref:L-lactate dehydrogenase n=1 Tax=Marinicellulosiphila megalodicopiae TaxID=2724896 RepID=UPI003BB18A53